MDTVSDKKFPKLKGGGEGDGDEEVKKESSEESPPQSVEEQKVKADNRLRELVVDNQIQEIVLKVFVGIVGIVDMNDDRCICDVCHLKRLQY